MATLFDKSLPYVVTYTGRRTPQSIAERSFTINRLPIDAEALVLEADGSGYVGGEYGADIYYFDASKQIIGAIVTPAALQPHLPAGTLNFDSLTRRRTAAAAKLDRSYMSGIERGVRNISLLNLAAVARALGTSMRELLPE